MGPESTSKDLLDLEQKNPISSSLESTLLLCKKNPLSQIPKPNTCSGKLVTSSIPKSQVLGKVKDFLGVMAEANTRLQHDARENCGTDYVIETLTGNENEYIEMDLVLGVADLHTPEAVAAAESAIAGSQSVIPLATASCSGYDTERSDDNDDEICSPDKPKESKSDEDVCLKNGQSKKRQKIIELH